MAGKVMPYRVEFAIKRLAVAVQASGYESIQVGVKGFEPTHASLFDADGNQTFFWCEDGKWTEGPYD